MIHLVVMNSIFEQSGVKSMIGRATKLISFFRKSPKAMGILRGHQVDHNGVPGCTLILGEKTRWSSYYNMLVRLMQQKRAIRCAEDDIDIATEYQPNPNDWMLIPKVIRLLKPFSDATLDAEHEYACISDTIPLIKKIFYELNVIDEFGIGTMKTEMVVQMNRYFRGQDPRVHFVDVEVSEVHAVATLLDPRYKTSGFMDKVKAEEAKVKLTSFASNIIEGSPAQTSFEIEANSSANSCWDEILSDLDDKFDSVSNLPLVVRWIRSETKLKKKYSSTSLTREFPES